MCKNTIFDCFWLFLTLSLKFQLQPVQTSCNQLWLPVAYFGAQKLDQTGPANTIYRLLSHLFELVPLCFWLLLWSDQREWVKPGIPSTLNYFYHKNPDLKQSSWAIELIALVLSAFLSWMSHTATAMQQQSPAFLTLFHYPPHLWSIVDSK